MACPLFVDYTRECITEIEVLPADTFNYCLTEFYKECPFFRVIKGISPICEYIKNCPMYAYFKVGDFEKFVKITKEYCLSENNVNCKRYSLRKSGKIPPPNLSPEGDLLEIEDKG
jgi:hypothetical protein